MATKKTDSKAKSTAKAPAKKPAKVVKAPKAPKAVPTTPPKARHPRGRVLENHGSKEALAKSLAALVASGEQDVDALEADLKRASNAQLLRLSALTQTVKQKWGSRDKLIDALGTSHKKSKDKDFLAKLATYSLPHLVDLARQAERAAKQHAAH